ncbi:MAG: DNA recombination protein RmuC [Gammaproteobacteria bacterium]|nr:DNA recombination protein RmuC [Gammaproteobacteria bacterium]
MGYFISRSKANAELARLQLDADLKQQQLAELESNKTEQQQTIDALKTELTDSKTNLALAKQQLESIQSQYKEVQEKHADAQGKCNQLLTSLSEQKSVSSSTQASLNAEKDRANKLNTALEAAHSELKQARQEAGKLTAENAELRTSQQEKEAGFKKQLAQFEEQKETLKKEFRIVANEIFEAKGKTFTETSKESLSALLNPFREQMTAFKAKVEDIHHKDTQQQSEMKTELKNLQKMNQEITEEAHNLATALKGKNKMQGNWGEMILENVLDRSGLVLDKDYKREVSFNTAEGRSRPDAIVYLPDNKHLVIDAKVSLNAYTRYVNAEDELEREQALKEHIAAFGDRIKELSDRNYYDLPGLNSPDMVFMFVPIESAFVEALKGDEMLFQKALEQNVLVATPTTLLTSLNIVRQLWRFEDQNKNTAELAEKAGKMYDKLNGFLVSMKTVGSSLDKAKETYDKAYGQLYTGRGNLIKQANEFKNLGVSVKAELPQELVDKAELELIGHDK